MNDLLRAVLEAPDDDVPRLVYADALMQAGDPRGEFIALQCANTPDADAQALRLLGVYKPLWIADLPNALDAYYERGFPHAIKLRCNRLDRPALDALDHAPIRNVVLAFDPDSDDKPPDSTSIAAWFVADPRTAHVESLDLTDFRWGPAALATLLRADLRSLAELVLRGSDCADAALLGIVNANAPFRRLSFTGHDATDLENTAYILGAERVSSRLEVLSVEECNLRSRGAQQLAAVPRWPHLRELSLRANRITDDGALAIAHSAAFPAVEKLVLGSNPITDSFLHALVDAARLPALTHLALDRCRITATGIAALTAAPRFARIHTLELAECPIGDAGAIAIATSPFNRALRSLDLYGTQLQVAGARAVTERLGDQLERLTVRIHRDTQRIFQERFGSRLNERF